MTVLEIAFVPYKKSLTKEGVDNAWKQPEKIITKDAKGLKAIYTGLMPTHPGIFLVVMIWDSIHSHHKFQHSPSYKPFIVSALPILAGDLDVIHFEITDRKALKKALESPVTQISHLHIKKGFVADFLKAYNASFEKYVAGENFNGMCINYPYEDAFSFYAFLGWQSEQDHYDVMKKEKYSEFRATFKDCINTDKDKGIKIYHAQLKKVYGDL